MEPIVFSGSPLDRVDQQRRDARWVSDRMDDAATRFLPLWRLDPLVKSGEPRGLAWARRVLFEDLDAVPEPLLLGLAEGVAHFAVDLSALGKPVEELGLAGEASFEDLRAVAQQLPAADAAIAAHARSLVDWNTRAAHCPACAGVTRPMFGGIQRNCFDCEAEHFPRTDPVAIALVVRGDRCLLGRGPGWPERMYSALAGFIEPGESIEEAARREVHEEAGVDVGSVRYVASQPWPFPASLMIGCIAEAQSDAVTVDHTELQDAAWFDRETVRRALEGDHAELIVPPPFAIAHHLMRAWITGD
ncbi:MAG: NAD(+) diphosphatase [Deltaproteobacteria bacterium]|nr:NAD(+) diphosphatase [Deltaproteobacteria bacterium]MBW2361793.1 NAD(+) diphosphatase [Deltaproteobacteria bacterium]